MPKSQSIPKTSHHPFFPLAFGEGSLLSVNGGLPAKEALEIAYSSLSQSLAVLYSFEPDEECCMDRMGAAINQVVLAQAVISSAISGLVKGGKS